MDAPKAAVRVSVLAVLALLVTLTVLSVSQRGPGAQAMVLDATGEPLVVPHQEGVTKGTWVGQPVLVVVTRSAVLAGVDQAYGKGAATPSLDLGGGLRVFVLSAKSTHLGCTVGFNAGLGASKAVADYDGDGLPDGRMLDPCHQGQWDVYHRGAPQPGTPTNGLSMASLRIALRSDGTLWGDGFDGHVGPPAR